MMRERLEDAGRHVAHELERFLNTLGTIASVAPLLGLLGTVTGIIKSFSVIYAGGLGDASALAGGISEALLATAFGLLVAIFAYITFRYLRGRVEAIVVRIEQDVTRFADALNDRMVEHGPERSQA
jgi:biopolymer transport protein ExbB